MSDNRIPIVSCSKNDDIRSKESYILGALINLGSGIKFDFIANRILPFNFITPEFSKVYQAALELDEEGILSLDSLAQTIDFFPELSHVDNKFAYLYVLSKRINPDQVIETYFGDDLLIIDGDDWYSDIIRPGILQFSIRFYATKQRWVKDIFSAIGFLPAAIETKDGFIELEGTASAFEISESSNNYDWHITPEEIKVVKVVHFGDSK